ncbi:DUF4192 family protein [Nocardia sp. NPDC059228]|uniref:DUF4192 family protein n=1 Tax=Nocardia sp. NPDC059228 TaxID=3346777 RepID=UPI0036B811AE
MPLPVSIGEPGDLIAAVPALLSFAPTRSLVLIVLKHGFPALAQHRCKPSCAQHRRSSKSGCRTKRSDNPRYAGVCMRKASPCWRSWSTTGCLAPPEAPRSMSVGARHSTLCGKTWSRRVWHWLGPGVRDPSP